MVQGDISLILALIVLETYIVHKEISMLQPLYTPPQSETHGLCIWTYLSCEVFVNDYFKAELTKQPFKMYHIQGIPFASSLDYSKATWSTNEDITVRPYISNHSTDPDKANW